jgi:heptaprenyl diphosphate synthase
VTSAGGDAGVPPGKLAAVVDQNPLQVMPSMADDLARVEAELTDAVRSGDDFLTEIASHLIAAGGKRVRPR